LLREWDRSSPPACGASTAHKHFEKFQMGRTSYTARAAFLFAGKFGAKKCEELQQVTARFSRTRTPSSSAESWRTVVSRPTAANFSIT